MKVWLYRSAITIIALWASIPHWRTPRHAVLHHLYESTGARETNQAAGSYHDIGIDFDIPLVIKQDEKRRHLFDHGMSSWDGWKFIHPNTDPSSCFITTTTNNNDNDEKNADENIHPTDNILLTLCECSDVPNHEKMHILWTHDKQGHLFTQYMQQFNMCLSGEDDGDTSTTSRIRYTECNESDDTQVWTRTSKGKFYNVGTQKILAKQSCHGDRHDVIDDDIQQPTSTTTRTPLILLDEYELESISSANTMNHHDDSSCDLFTVAGPYEHDPYNIGHVYFHQLGKDLSPGAGDGDDGDGGGSPASTDYLFGSSVSIDDDGKVVVIGGSIPVKGDVFGGDETYVGIITVYKLRSSRFREHESNDWTKTVTYHALNKRTYLIPKVTVTISGDAKRVAIGVETSDDNGTIEVLDFIDHDDKELSALIPVGSIIEGHNTGELPGLKLAMDRHGDTLVIGCQYFDGHDDNDENDNSITKNAGRVRIFTYNSDENSYILTKEVIGQTNDDQFGSAVSISSDGALVAFGVSGADIHKRNSGRTSVLKRTRTHTTNTTNNDENDDSNNHEDWVNIGDIFGEATGDESGFSVKVVNVVGDNKIRLVVGAIYNDGNNQINSGHVRVYECADFDNINNMNNCQESWTQIGSDIDGDNGVVLGADAFHVGDAFGYSLDMSEDGRRLVIGAPFHSASRASDYYSGSVKMFELSSITDDWEQLGHGLIGDGTAVLSGYSVGLSRDGKTLVVGSPGEPSGSAQVYLQDEVSNMPSMNPTLFPTPVQSSEPSPLPSTSTSPTSSPTVSECTERFQIRSTYSRFDKVIASYQAWCMEAFSATSKAKLNMRPCDKSSFKQVWRRSDEGRIYLQDRPRMALSFEGKQLWLQDIDKAQPFIVNKNENSISVLKESNGKRFYIGIDSSKLFSRLRLYTEGNDNESLFSWHMDCFASSMSPSSSISQVPTESSKNNSPSPTIIRKSFTTTAGPSYVPSSEPTMSPSLLPSATPTSSSPTAGPSSVPSSEPTISPSLLPSATPTLSLTSLIEGPFQIRSTYSRFDKVIASYQAWCMEAFSATSKAKLNMRPCDKSSFKQVWRRSDEGRIYLQDRPRMALSFEGKQLWLQDIDKAQPFIVNKNENSISVLKESNGKRFYIGIDSSKLFSRLRLYTEGNDNESLFSWQFQVF